MDNKQIQEETDWTKLVARRQHSDVRKKERRLLKRKLARLLPAEKVKGKPKKATVVDDQHI